MKQTNLSPEWKAKYDKEMSETRKFLPVSEDVTDNLVAHRLVGASEFQERAIEELNKLLAQYEENKHKMTESDYKQRNSLCSHYLTIIKNLKP